MWLGFLPPGMSPQVVTQNNEMRTPCELQTFFIPTGRSLKEQGHRDTLATEERERIAISARESGTALPPPECNGNRQRP